MNAPSPLAVMTEDDRMPVQMDTSTSALMFLPERMNAMLAMADVMATGMATIPQHLRKSRGDCLAVCMQAAQWRMNPFAVAQKTHLVQGTLGYEAQLVNAVVTTMAPTKDRLNYEWFGDWAKIMGKFEERESKHKKDEDTGKPQTYRVPAWKIADEAGLGVRVWATMKGETEPRVLELLLVQCRVRNSTLWADDPRQQIAYLAVKRWTRLHCPDVLLGVYTPDELESAPTVRDMGEADVVGQNTDSSNRKAGLSDEQLKQWRAEASKGMKAARQHWAAMGATLRGLATEAQKIEMQGLANKADSERTVDSGASAPAGATPAADADGVLSSDPFVRDMQAAEVAARSAGSAAMGAGS